MGILFEWLLSIIREFQFWLIVQPWDRALRTRLGRNPRVLAEGIHWKIPLVDTVQVVSTQQQTYPFPSQTLWSADGRPVTVAGLIKFRIVDPCASQMAMKEPETICAAQAQTAVTEYVSERSVADMRLGELRQTIFDALVGAVPGIEFDEVAITEFGAFRTLRLLQESWRPYTQTEGENKKAGW